MADSITPIQQVIAGTGAAVAVNENFDAASPAMIFGRHAATTTGLTWGYIGGRWGGAVIASATVALTASSTNYIVVDTETLAVSASVANTKWLDAENYARLYKATAGPATVTAYEDHRAGPGGIFGGGLGAGVISDTADRLHLGPGSHDANKLAGDDDHRLDITNDPSVDAGLHGYGLQFARFNSYGSGYGGNHHYCRYGGTEAAPTAVTNGMYFMSYGYRGWTGSALSESAAAFQAIATENWNAGANGIKFRWEVTANGASVRALGMELLSTGLEVAGSVKSGGNVLGTREVLQNSKSADYTLVLSDSGKHIYHPSVDETARVWTIPSNSSVAYPVGTAITFDNDYGAGDITIAITSDTLVLIGIDGSTGSRTLASGGQATAIKVSATRWRIGGVGLS